MSNDENMIINNILSLLTELKQIESGEGEEPVQEELAQTAEDLEPKKPVMMAKAEGEGMEDKEKKDKEDKKDEMSELEKALVETSTDGTDANDNSEERIDDVNTNITDESIKEVAKAVVQLLNKNKVVKKTKDNSKDLIVKALMQLSSRVVEQDKALNNIFKGLGIADEIIAKNKPENKVQKGLNNTNDINNSLAYILKQIESNKQVEKAEYEQPLNQVRKSLGNRSTLAGLVDPDRFVARK